MKVDIELCIYFVGTFNSIINLKRLWEIEKELKVQGYKVCVILKRLEPRYPKIQG